jgi:hypothetical protein
MEPASTAVSKCGCPEASGVPGSRSVGLDAGSPPGHWVRRQEFGVGVEPFEEARRVSYVSVEHEPDVWVDAHVEKRWKRGGQSRLSVYYFVDGRQYYRTYDEDNVRPVTSVELQDDEKRDESAGTEPPQVQHEGDESIDLRDGQHIRRLD